MIDPTVSVVLTSYNQGHWLRQSIESVLGQTYSDWELILIDNGSSDDSPTIIEDYRRHPKVTVTRYERNSPHTVISNHGIQRARGRYVSFLYSDDYYLAEKLERQVATFENLSARHGVVYSAGYRLMPDGQLRYLPCGMHAGNVLRALLTEPQFFMPIAPLVRRECLLRYPFNETIFIEGEFLATGIPVVINDGVGDPGWIVSEHRVGVVVPDTSVADIEAALPVVERVLRDPLIGQRCRETARRYFDLKEGVEKYAALYERLAGADAFRPSGTAR